MSGKPAVPFCVLLVSRLRGLECDFQSEPHGVLSLFCSQNFLVSGCERYIKR